MRIKCAPVIIGSYTIQKLLCTSTIIRIFLLKKTFTEHSFSSHREKNRWKGRKEAIDRTKREKMNSLLYDLWCSIFAMAYLHWYQTNSRWQPSESLSAIKRNANCQQRQKNCVRIRVIYLDFGCVKLLVVFWSDSLFVFARFTRQFVKFQFHLLTFEMSQYFSPVFVVVDEIMMICNGK